jgi:hypothetical protein
MSKVCFFFIKKKIEFLGLKFKLVSFEITLLKKMNSNGTKRNITMAPPSSPALGPLTGFSDMYDEINSLPLDSQLSEEEEDSFPEIPVEAVRFLITATITHRSFDPPKNQKRKCSFSDGPSDGKRR